MTENACCGLPGGRHYCHDSACGTGARAKVYLSLKLLCEHVEARKHVDPVHEISSAVQPRATDVSAAFFVPDDGSSVDEHDLTTNASTADTSTATTVAAALPNLRSKPRALLRDATHAKHGLCFSRTS